MGHIYCSGMFNITNTYSGKSNMECEWQCLNDTMEMCYNNYSGQGFNIFTDSLFLYKQLHWIYRVKSKRLKPYYFAFNKLKNLLSGIAINYCFVSGHENDARDGLY